MTLDETIMLRVHMNATDADALVDAIREACRRLPENDLSRGDLQRRVAPLERALEEAEQQMDQA